MLHVGVIERTRLVSNKRNKRISSNPPAGNATILAEAQAIVKGRMADPPDTNCQHLNILRFV